MIDQPMLTKPKATLILDTLLKEWIVNVTLVIIGVESVSVIFVQLSMLSEASRQVRVRQVVSTKANQICMVFLQTLYCTFSVVSTCIMRKHNEMDCISCIRTRQARMRRVQHRQALVVES